MANKADSAASKWADIQSKIAEFKGKESTLDSKGWKDYLDTLHQANVGPENFDALQTQSVAKFKADLTKALQNSPLSRDPNLSGIIDEAAQRFVVERKTGEQSLTDFINQRFNIQDPITRDEVVKSIGSINNVGSYIPQAQGDYSNELVRVSQKLVDTQKSEAEAQKQVGIETTSAEQQAQSQFIFNQAQTQLAQPGSAFTDPGLIQAALDDIQKRVLTQGASAMGNVEAGAVARGITGSSTEQFGLASTQKAITDSLTSQTLNFLLQAGQQGEQAKQFIVSTLQQHAQSLLGAGQQTQQLGVSKDISQQGLDLQRQSLQNQVLQFNQQLQAQEQMFGQQLEFQKQTAAENMQLLLRQLGQPSGGNFGIPGLGLGAAAGLGISALLAPFTGGLSLGAGLGIGAGVGGAAGYGLGSLFGK